VHTVAKAIYLAVWRLRSGAQRWAAGLGYDHFKAKAAIRLRIRISVAIIVISLVVELTGTLKGDQSVHVTEKHQPSVAKDPAVKGEISNGWLVPGAGASLPQPTPTQSDLLEWVKLFKNTQAPRVVEEDLSPGTTRSVQLQIAGPSGLFGSARWVGTISRPLAVRIALNGSTLTTGAAYHVGRNRGGSFLQTRTTASGLATMSVTNTSASTIKVRIIFTATGL
jgi:hypothetical protein